jgi:hypothetical protein
LIQSAADSVRLFYVKQGKLPATLDEITSTPPLLDMFGNPLEYSISSNQLDRFTIRSVGLPSSDGQFTFEIEGTNLLQVRAAGQSE